VWSQLKALLYRADLVLDTGLPTSPRLKTVCMTAQLSSANITPYARGRDRLLISTRHDSGEQATVMDQTSRSIEWIITEETQIGKNNI
tara:strand:+ start:149 stop:412 length:264 start_codon:yes stop_codon:yes gene_type:complete